MHDELSPLVLKGALDKSLDFKLYPERWFQLFIFFNVLFISSAIMVSFSAVSVPIAKMFKVNEMLINSSVLVFMIAFIPANFMVMDSLRTYGMR